MVLPLFFCFLGLLFLVRPSPLPLSRRSPLPLRQARGFIGTSLFFCSFDLLFSRLPLPDRRVLLHHAERIMQANTAGQRSRETTKRLAIFGAQ